MHRCMGKRRTLTWLVVLAMPVLLVSYGWFMNHRPALHVQAEWTLTDALIQNSDLSILDICMETGFSSSRYLNKLFEEKMGCTAREYLKTSKKPHLIDTVLPTDNIQKRYSFEQSAFILQKVPD